MDECKLCKQDRLRLKQAPRELVSISTPHSTFKQPELQTKLCEYCDGEALEKAQRPMSVS